MHRSVCLWAALAGMGLAAAACGPREQEKGVDPTTVDRGLADKPGPADVTPPSTTVTLPGDTQVEATPMQAQLQQYLQSGQTAERRFQFDSLRFEGDQLRQDPNDSLTTLAALLNAHPQTKVQVHAYAAAGEPQSAGADRAAKVAQALIQAGVDAGRVTSSGATAPHAGEDRVELIVRPGGAGTPAR